MSKERWWSKHCVTLRILYALAIAALIGDVAFIVWLMARFN